MTHYREMPELPIGIDTETTGVDIWHGCRPFFVSSYDPLKDDDDQVYWEWDVDPLTRQVLSPKEDILAVKRFLSKKHLVLHNAKFDVRALEATFGTLDRKTLHNTSHKFDWDLIDCTLTSSHCVRSLGSHKLKDICLQYLDIDTEDQKELQVVVNECRRIGKSLGWRIAKEGDPHFPAIKPKKDEGWWVYDMWLPRAVAKHKDLPENHLYWRVCKRYAMLDAKRTALVYLVLKEALEELGLTEQYEERRRLLQTTHRMETYGVTVSRVALEDAKLRYGLIAERDEGRCIALSGGTLENPRSSKQLQETLYSTLKLTPVKQTKTGFSTDKDTLNFYCDTLTPNTKQYQFVKCLLNSRKHGTGVRYLTSYEKYGCISTIPHSLRKEYFRLHPNINTTATRTTRAASSDPNEQNISKLEGFNLREVFGPLPGREWYSADYSNIEMRLFAYAAEDKDMITAFETGYKVHLLMCKILWPTEWAECERKGLDFSKVYESTLYQWTKNGNFSLIYGAQKARADATYHQSGAYELIRTRMPRIDNFMSMMEKQVRKVGYVTTMGGYRLYVPRTKPYAGVNYYIQGSAGWYLIKAMNRIDTFFQRIPDHFMNMTVHDELDLDVPIQHNYDMINTVADIMEYSGKELGVHVPVSVERHKQNWADGVKLDKIDPNWRRSSTRKLELLNLV